MRLISSAYILTSIGRLQVGRSLMCDRNSRGRELSLESPIYETSFSIYVVDIGNMSSIRGVVAEKIKTLFQNGGQ